MSEEKVNEQEVQQAQEEQNEAQLQEDDMISEVETVEEDLKEEEEVIEDEIALAAKEQQAMKDQMLRLQADFENFRKRAQREKVDIANYTMENFLTKLLPVLDNLERAEKNTGGSLEAYQQGVQMVIKQFFEVLNNEGLKEIEAEGKTFDPNFHHGVAVEASDAHENDQITDVYQKGYTYKDKVIRPAMVKVCQK